MSNSDSAAARTARSSEVEETAMSEISETYIREQLEKRRDELSEVVATAPPTVPAEYLLGLLHDVESALHRLDDGTYGICTECHDSVEKDRLLADPLVTLCLDHLTNTEPRARAGFGTCRASAARAIAADESVPSRLEYSLSIQTRGHGQRRLL